jgi:hypothetical protein
VKRGWSWRGNFYWHSFFERHRAEVCWEISVRLFFNVFLWGWACRSMSIYRYS